MIKPVSKVNKSKAVTQNKNKDATKNKKNKQIEIGDFGKSLDDAEKNHDSNNLPYYMKGGTMVWKNQKLK